MHQLERIDSRIASDSETASVAPAPVSGYRAQSSRRAFLREFVLVVACAFGYTLAAGAAPSQRDTAVIHGQQILSFEQATGLDIELGLNRFLSAHPLLAECANHFYTIAFFLTAAVTLLLLWWVDRSRYYVHRTILFIMTAGALVTYWLYPVAPPRLLPNAQFVDTVADAKTFGSLYGTAGADLVNVYGAMPSMHTGWSIWVAVALCSIATAWWQKGLAWGLPAITVLVIVSTANHYLLDAIVGACYYLVAVALYVMGSRLMAQIKTDRRMSAPGGQIARS